MRNVDISTREVADLYQALEDQILNGQATLEQFRWFILLDSHQRNLLMELGEDERVPMRKSILRPVVESLVIPVTDGKEAISSARSVFTGSVDTNFASWGADEASGPTPETPVMVCDLVFDSTFSQMFSSLGVPLEQVCLAQSQIVVFVREYKKHLQRGGWPTHFLFKSRKKLFVAQVRFLDDINLGARVFPYGLAASWSRDHPNSVVVPQQ